jgi:hypothetical protein
MRLAAALLVSACLTACTLADDPASTPNPQPLGTGMRIAQVQDPSSPSYAPNHNVNLSSLAVLWLDTFDETKDGKSQGTLYLQDVGSGSPYAGMSAYQSSFVPADLRVLPGDVLDVVGPYQETLAVGKAMFGIAPDGKTQTSLPQLYKPVSTFRYEFRTPDPVVVKLPDLNEDNYLQGRKWEGMLVTVQDVTVIKPVNDGSGRITYGLQGNGDKTDGNEVAVSNELYDLKDTDYPAGTHFKSITGIVTWFFSYQIAPRSPADLVQ